MVNEFRKEAKEEFDKIGALCAQCKRGNFQSMKDFQLCVVDLIAESALAMYFLQRVEGELDAWFRESGSSIDSLGVEKLKKDIRNMYYACRGINESFIDIDATIRFRLGSIA